VIQTVGDPPSTDPVAPAAPPTGGSNGGDGGNSGNGSDDTPAAAPAAPRNRGGRPPKAQPVAQATPPVDDPLAPDDLAGPVDPSDDDGDALGLSPPTLSPGEMHAKGLVMSRELFNRGDKKAVKHIQTQMGIAKFTDIPIAEGPKLYKLAKELCDKAGIHV